MSIGRMVEQLVLQQDVATSNTHGSQTPSVWDDLATVWAELLAVAGNEQLEASRVGSTVPCRFRIRARADVTAKMRALWTPVWPVDAAQRVVEIHGVLRDPENREYQLLECSTHDAAPIANAATANPSWIQEGWTQ